jgi:hypothetical protein
MNDKPSSHMPRRAIDMFFEMAKQASEEQLMPYEEEFFEAVRQASVKCEYVTDLLEGWRATADRFRKHLTPVLSQQAASDTEK